MKATRRLIFAAMLFLYASAQAQVWNPTSGNFWSTAANWNPTGVPANNGTAAIVFSGSAGGISTIDTSWNINSLTFGLGAGAFTLNGNNGIILTVGAGGIVNNSTTADTISASSIALSASETWSASAGGLSFTGSTINLGGNTLTIDNAIASTIADGIQGNGNLTKMGSGNLTLSAAQNSFNGTTTVLLGTLFCQATVGPAITGNLVIGTSFGAANGATVSAGSNNPPQLATTSNVTVNASGDWLAATQAIASLTVNGGNVMAGAFNSNEPLVISNSLTMNGGAITGNFSNSIILGGGISTLASSSSATISNTTLNLGGATQTFSVARGTATYDLNISANIVSGAIVKSGSGILRLGGANGVSGGFTLNAGTVVVGNSSAFGTGTIQINGGTFSEDASTYVIGNPLIMAADFSIAGSFPLTFTGAATLTSNRTISVDPSTATGVFSGVITDNGNGYGLTKSGAGVLQLNAANSYSGQTAVSAGTLKIGNAAALGSSPLGVLVNSGGTLDLNGIGIGFMPITLNGPGGTSVGALINSSATATTIAGTITLASASTILNSSGGMTVSGGITGAYNLTFDGTATATVNSTINIGAASLIKNGTGTLTLAGSNTSNGQTAVNTGTLLLSSSTMAIGGNLQVGDGVGAASGDVARLGAPNQLASTASVAIASTGLFDTNGFNTTISALTVDGGAVVSTGAGTLTVTNGITHTTNGASATSLGGTVNAGGSFTNNGTSTISGTYGITGGVNNPGTLTVSANGSLTAGGTLTNSGTATISGVSSVSGGVSNPGSLTIAATGSLTAQGSGVSNTGTMILSGGVLSSGTQFVNNSSLSGNGTISGAGTFQNNGQFTLNGSVAINTAATNVNAGNLNLAMGATLNLGGGMLTNSGTINLNSGSIAGAAMLRNDSSGIVSGLGFVFAPFFNNGGTILLTTAGTTNFVSPFTNAGEILLSNLAANAAGGLITNTGTIDGFGRVGNPVTNTGNIEAIGGILTISGALSNSAGGSILAGSGTKVLISSGLTSNAGLINPTGGTFDNNGHALTNTGQISGYGSFRTGGAGLTNNGTATFTGGLSTVNGDVVNGGRINVEYNPAIFTGNVTNNGIFKTTSTTATFTGTFTNNGTYSSDPATQNFSDLAIGNNGVMLGGTGDIFNVSGNVSNDSTQSSAFDISGAQLTLQGTANHDFTWSGADLGQSASGYVNNFSIGVLEVQSGGSLTVLDGNATGGVGLYVEALELDGGISQIASIIGNGANIYYDPNVATNAYLGDQTYALSGGGVLAPVAGQVPEPNGAGLLGAGLISLAALRFRFRRNNAA